MNIDHGWPRIWSDFVSDVGRRGFGHRLVTNLGTDLSLVTDCSHARSRRGSGRRFGHGVADLSQIGRFVRATGQGFGHSHGFGHGPTTASQIGFGGGYGLWLGDSSRIIAHPGNSAGRGRGRNAAHHAAARNFAPALNAMIDVLGTEQALTTSGEPGKKRVGWDGQGWVGWARPSAREGRARLSARERRRGGCSTLSSRSLRTRPSQTSAGRADWTADVHNIISNLVI